MTDTTAPCCTRDEPHPFAIDLAGGMTHYVKTGRVTLPPDLIEPTTRGRLDSPADLEQRIADLETKAAVLRSQIAAALEALRIPHPDEPYNAWVNSGNRWNRAAHNARLALGAEQ